MLDMLDLHYCIFVDPSHMRALYTQSPFPQSYAPVSFTWTCVVVYRQDPAKQYPHFWNWAHGDPKWSQVTRVFPGDGSQWRLEALQRGGGTFLKLLFYLHSSVDIIVVFVAMPLSSCLCYRSESTWRKNLRNMDIPTMTRITKWWLRISSKMRTKIKMVLYLRGNSPTNTMSSKL